MRKKGGKKAEQRRVVVKITHGNRVLFVNTHFSLLAHITERYKQQKPYSEAVQQAPGAGDLTSPSSSSCTATALFREHPLGAGAANLYYISIHSEELSVTPGATSSTEAFSVRPDPR